MYSSLITLVHFAAFFAEIHVCCAEVAKEIFDFGDRIFEQYGVSLNSRDGTYYVLIRI